MVQETCRLLLLDLHYAINKRCSFMTQFTYITCGGQVKRGRFLSAWNMTWVIANVLSIEVAREMMACKPSVWWIAVYTLLIGCLLPDHLINCQSYRSLYRQPVYQCLGQLDMLLGLLLTSTDFYTDFCWLLLTSVDFLKWNQGTDTVKRPP